ncbi:MAG TPA: NUDIX hydrolase [Patescibacteria group bacterium]|nr:NUDIX hydrolase [Patescibacteria group bacterium]
MAASKSKILTSDTMFTGSVFSVRRERIIEPSGLETTKEVVIHPGSVVVLPVFPNGDILLVRQYRHSVGCYLWEIVAGSMEPRESPLAGARRELQEETGYTARRWRKLMDIFPTPGFLSEHMVVFACEGLTPGPPRPDADEQIRTRQFPLRTLERMMRTGRLRDTKTIASILYYSRFVRREIPARCHSAPHLRAKS